MGAAKAAAGRAGQALREGESNWPELAQIDRCCLARLALQREKDSADLKREFGSIFPSVRKGRAPGAEGVAGRLMRGWGQRVEMTT